MSQNTQQPLYYLPAILLALAPALYIGIGIYLYSVDLPQWDEWGLVQFHEKFAIGTLSLRDLFMQFNEYRQFFPNLVFVGLGYLTKGDPRYVMYVTFIVACLISYNIFKLSEKTLPISRAQRWWLLAAANLLFFSPVPVENWLQGQQLIYFVPAAALTTCLRIAYSDNSRPYLKLICCGLLSVISTFSSANGFVCWVLMVPALLWAPAWSSVRYKSACLSAWLIGFALSIAIYLNGYRKPPTNPELTHVIAHPVQDFLYWLSLLGLPFAFGRIVLSVTTGTLLVGLFLWATVTYVRVRKSALSLTPGMLCWLLLGGYSIATAALIMIGRAGLGISQSLSNRYATFTILLPVAVVYLLTPRHGIVRLGQTMRTAVVLVLLIVVHVPIYIYGIRNMRAMQVSVLYEKACIHLTNVVNDDCQTLEHTDAARLRALANSLDHLGYLRPPLAKSGLLRELAATNVSEPEDYGSFTKLEATGTSEYTASGLAGLPHRKGPADAVLLACGSENREPQIIGVADLMTQRESVSSAKRAYEGARWSKTFESRELLSACTMTAWAFDASSGKAFQISGAHTIATQVARSNDR